jgi:hypothetical protein
MERLSKVNSSTSPHRTWESRSAIALERRSGPAQRKEIVVHVKGRNAAKEERYRVVTDSPLTRAEAMVCFDLLAGSGVFTPEGHTVKVISDREYRRVTAGAR